MSRLKHVQMFHLYDEVSTTWDIGHSLLEFFLWLNGIVDSQSCNAKTDCDIETWKSWSCMFFLESINLVLKPQICSRFPFWSSLYLFQILVLLLTLESITWSCINCGNDHCDVNIWFHLRILAETNWMFSYRNTFVVNNGNLFLPL